MAMVEGTRQEPMNFPTEPIGRSGSKHRAALWLLSLTGPASGNRQGGDVVSSAAACADGPGRPVARHVGQFRQPGLDRGQVRLRLGKGLSWRIK
jgi:hypothetical protein